MTLSRRELIQRTALLSAGSLLASSHLSASTALKYREYLSYDGLGLANLVRSKQVSPLELLEMAIARTETLNPALNAVVLKHYELAREAIGQGLPDGVFSGVPFLLKDLGIAMTNTITTEGSVFFKDQRFTYDSSLVER